MPVAYIHAVQWTEWPKVIAWRARRRSVDVAVRTAEGFRKHRSGRNAALIAHFGFLSVFPLFVVFTTILGFVLQSHAELRKRIINSAMSQVPVIGQQLSSDPTQLRGDALVLALGLAVTLWSGMKAFVAVHNANDDIAETPLDHRASAVRTRLRALLGIAYIGGAQIAAAILASVVGITGIPVVSKVLAVIGTAAIDAGILLLSYRWLRTTEPTWRSLLPGAIVGGALFALLQLLGVTIVGRQIANASPIYGTFASVIGLLYWMSLHAMVAIGGAELNAALVTDEPPRPPDCE